MIPPTFVLHCAELPERTAAVRAHLAERGIDATYWRSFHGKTWGLRTVLEYDAGKVISPGHVGLNLGTWSLWQHIHQMTAPMSRGLELLGKSLGNDAVMILEDDVVLPPDFGLQFHKLLIQLDFDFPDWDLVFLGLAEVEPHVWHKVTDRIGKPDSNLCRMNDPFGTHAYMVRRRALPVLLDNMAVAQRNLDQQLWERVLKPGLLKWCAVLPSIITQRTFDYTGVSTPEWGPSTVEVGEEGFKGYEETGPTIAASESEVQRAVGGKDIGGTVVNLADATSLLIDPYPCIYRGEFLEEFGRDRSGRSVPLAYCSRLGVACHSRANVTVKYDSTEAKSCQTCPLRVQMPSTDRPRLPIPEGHFNPSILMWDGKLILATRDSWGHAKVALWELTNSREDWTGEWAARAIGSYGSDHPDAPRLEDPRLFITSDPETGSPRLCAMLNLPDGYPPKRVQVGYVRFASDLSGIEHTEVYKSPQNNLYEKNWVPFSDGRELRWIYATKPEHCVIGETGTFRSPNPLPWAGGVVRGGAAPVHIQWRVTDRLRWEGRYDEEYAKSSPKDYPVFGGASEGPPVFYHFFHGCLKRVQGSVYTVGCCVFEAKPPFRILRQTPLPLIWPDLPAVGEEVVKRYVVWPGGVVPHAGAWHLALGIDDTNCRIVRLPFADVEAALSDVPETSAGVSIRDTPLARGTRDGGN